MKSLQDLDVLIDQVSNVTGLSQDEISEQMESANINSFKFADTILVSPEDFDSIIDAWAEKIKASLRTGNDDKPSRVTVADSADSLEEEIEGEEDSDLDSDEADGALAWPRGYKKVVTHLYGPTLKKILPEDLDQRQRFLEAIANDTEIGQKLIGDLATAIVKRSKRKLSRESVLDGLKRKIEDLLMNG
ncbi:hypothetical protein [Lyngbya confervoides]|uniref:Uncharacterized protein n=1 Tax=Lyngbya confervoides BDU141951 TaxID=1574623 RepID=A0ABD4SZY1_9CYAN|nr:hypothetical protein [Lyngbya confervoides]MCM1981839.1 hypothetical protein [Lyngbya confervoides BDU141951]